MTAPLDPLAVPPLPAIPGFRFAGLSAGIKANGRPDLALMVSDSPCPAAGLLTSNLVKAAPVLIAQARLRAGTLQAVLVNSGNANACTGPAGHRAALASCNAVSQALNIQAGLLAPASTGVIGALLPAQKIVDAAPALVADLSTDGASRFCAAIMTTDQWPKYSHRKIRVSGGAVSLLAMAKGAGMIHPNMATTLCFVATDAGISAPTLKKALRAAASTTFNSISVDGDTSTNDALLAMASGAGPKLKTAQDVAAFTRALTEVLDDVSRSIVKDGEGAQHVVTFTVAGLPSTAACRKVAQTIATSPLVKTALHGRDANWGRILAAAGRSGVKFNPSIARIDFVSADALAQRVAVVQRGQTLGTAAEKAAQEMMSAGEYNIEVRLGSSKHKAHCRTCDLGHSYIDVNANYRS